MLLVTLILAAYVYLEGFFNKLKDDHLVEIQKELDQNPDKVYSVFEQYKFDIYVNANVGVYSIAIIILGIKYNEIAKTYVETMNIQFQSHYDNQLITMFFMFNFLNFYLPLLLVAVLYTLFTYEDVFTLIASQMVFKQIFANVMEYITPMMYTRRRLNKLKKYFKDVIYEDNKKEDFKQLDESGKVIEETNFNKTIELKK